jgi:tripartite-type tricarboxylate transporter receptor subunit TctC
MTRTPISSTSAPGSDSLQPRHQPSRREWLVKAGALAGVAMSGAVTSTAWAQTYPSHPLRMVVPLPAGGVTDVMARLIAQKLGELWGQTVIVDNKGGAGTIIGTQAVAKSAPDGYTFGMVISAHTINPSMHKDLPYDTVNDFTPLTQVGFAVMALVAHKDFPANDVAGLIREAKAKPGIPYASLGIGTATQLAGELLKVKTGIDLTHVPYPGSAPAYNDLLSGRVPVGFVVLESAVQHVKAGNLKVLAITNAKRSKIYPDYPTIGETIPGYALESMFGFVGPKGMPPAIAAKLSHDLIQVLQVPATRNRMGELGTEVVASQPKEFDAFIRSQITMWEPLVKASGAKIE